MEKVKILKAVDIINDSVSEYEGERPFLSTGDLNLSTITNLELHTFSEKPSRANQNVSSGDLILARMQGTVKVKLINNEDENIIVSTGFLVLRPKSDTDKNYLFHLLKSSNFQNDKDKLCTGATQKAINNSNFEKLEIPLPNLATQQRIAAILDQADAIIQNNRAIVQKYDALTQSLFLDMFGDPVKNEKGWEKEELKNFGKISTGNTPSRADLKNYDNHYIEWIKTDNIIENEFYISKAQEYLSFEGAKKGRIVNENSLLVTCIAGSLQSIGRAGISNRKVAFNQQINAIEPNNEVNISFLYFLIKNSRKYIQDHASSGMKRMLSKGEFEKIKMILPPIQLQNQFAERVAMIEAQKQQAQLELAKSEELFQSLLQRAFKGELN